MTFVESYVTCPILNIIYEPFHLIHETIQWLKETIFRKANSWLLCKYEINKVQDLIQLIN